MVMDLEGVWTISRYRCIIYLYYRVNGGAVEGGVAQSFQVVEGGFFNLGFGHAVVTHGVGSLSLEERVAVSPGTRYKDKT